MRAYEIMTLDECAGVGLIVPGVNTTPDVKPGEPKRQAKKWGFDVDDQGVPVHSFWDSKDLIKKD